MVIGHLGIMGCEYFIVGVDIWLSNWERKELGGYLGFSVFVMLSCE